MTLKNVCSENQSWGLERAGSAGMFLHKEKIQLTKGKSALMESTYICVLVPSGCYNKIPQTGGLINSRYLFLTVLEAGSLRSVCQHGRVRGFFQVADFYLYPHMGRGPASTLGPLLQGR